jgi:porin
MRRIRAVAVLAATAACVPSSALAAPAPQAPAGRAVTSVCVLCQTAREDSSPIASRSAQDPVSRPDCERLTGDWGGARHWLSGRGVDVQFEVTGFVQGMMSGTGNDDTEPGGRIDALVNFDTARLGLWRGSGFRTHVETALGDMPQFRAGAVLPMHAATMLPLDTRNEVVATSLYFTQQFGRTASLMLGRINVVDLLARDPFFGGWGIHRFDNIAFVAPPSGLLPPVVVGGLLAVARAPWTYTVMVYDPNDMTAEYWDRELFTNGFNTQVGATWSGTVDGRATSIGTTATYSTEEGADLSEVLLPPELRGGTKTGSWGVNAQLGHLIAPSRMVPGRGLGMYGRVGLSDGNPNIIRGFLVGGLAGHGVLASRPQDSFGLGYYFYNFSNDLQQALAPAIGVGDEQGAELFYRLAIRGWFRVGANLQIVNPATRANRTAVVGSVRANVVF